MVIVTATTGAAHAKQVRGLHFLHVLFAYALFQCHEHQINKTHRTQVILVLIAHLGVAQMTVAGRERA